MKFWTIAGLMLLGLVLVGSAVIVFGQKAQAGTHRGHHYAYTLPSCTYDYRARRPIFRFCNR